MIYTERTKRVLSIAWDEAEAMGCDYVGTDHLLLALLREQEGPHRPFLQAGEIWGAAAVRDRIRQTHADVIEGEVVDEVRELPALGGR